MILIGEDYREFCADNCNRRDFIVSYLEKRGVKAVVLPIDGHEHIYVKFSKDSYNPAFKIKTVIAHYDRFEGSPGANDNSSSVFALMDWAINLSFSGMVHNVRLIFTDGEEIGSSSNGGKSVSDQGAFGLASVFKRLGITDDDVFVFDCVGRGTVPVMSRTYLPKKINSDFKRRFIDLKERTENLLRSTSGGNFVSLPVSYSDNAGFIACGIPAVAITFLPYDEASRYMFDLVRIPVLENYVTNHEIPEYFDKSQLDNMIPVTWKLFHTKADNLQSLTQESFYLMERILFALASMRTYACL
ncbi:MAG: M28 family peptidase [Treponema sp.]|nr:M28 family peptidase [Treponema sp.]